MDSIINLSSDAEIPPSPCSPRTEKVFDPLAALGRAEGLVAYLREGHVTEGFRPNNRAAARMLGYFRTEANERGSATDREFEAVCDFCNIHGQSLDWLFFGDPAVMVCRAAKNSPRARTIAFARKRRAMRGRGPSQFDRYRLPFFNANEPVATRCWSVRPTEDYSKDCDTGAAYAIEFLRGCDGTHGWRSLLSCIVTSMISAGASRSRASKKTENNGIVVGFMTMIGAALNWQNVTRDVADALELCRADEKAKVAAVYKRLRLAESRRDRAMNRSNAKSARRRRIRSHAAG